MLIEIPPHTTVLAGSATPLVKQFENAAYDHGQSGLGKFEEHHLRIPPAASILPTQDAPAHKFAHYLSLQFHSRKAVGDWSSY